MDRFTDFAEELTPDELVQLRTFIAEGNATKVLNHFIEILEGSRTICPVCERAVDETRDLVLFFGPTDFRQKARFCGHDCLEYFLTHRKVSPESLNTVHDDEEMNGFQ